MKNMIWKKKKHLKKKKISEIRIKLNKINNIFAISPKNSKVFQNHNNCNYIIKS